MYQFFLPHAGQICVGLIKIIKPTQNNYMNVMKKFFCLIGFSPCSLGYFYTQLEEAEVKGECIEQFRGNIILDS